MKKMVFTLLLTGCTTAQYEPGQVIDWPMALSNEQLAQALDLNTRPQFSALSVSPSGAWGKSWGRTSQEIADIEAMDLCQQHLKIGQLNCFIYSRNGETIRESSIELKSVSFVLHPYNSGNAVSYFGFKDFTFNGNLSLARQEVQIDREISDFWDESTSTPLKEELIGTTLARRQTYLYLGSGFAELHYKVSASNILITKYEKWNVNESGLLCMYKNDGHRNCYVIENIEDGIASIRIMDGTGSAENWTWIDGNATIKSSR